MSLYKTNIYIKLGYLLLTTSLVLVLLPNWPHLYYRISPQTSKILASTIASTASESSLAIETTSNQDSYDRPSEPSAPPPPRNIDLPLETTLVIPKIQVDAPVVAGDDWQEILTHSIWQVPDFGTPEDASRPIILASHRWGYIHWSQQFRLTRSFYNLPKLTIGDRISLIYNQRQYEYIVYSTESGTSIPEYSADIILYTCELWNSPQRFFVFGKLVTSSDSP
jgi:sortase (surface protein transpeptidase)